MKQFILLTICCLIFQIVVSQNITIAEYYFDGNDLGLGNNSTLTVTSSVEDYNISIAGLSNGFHDLHIRVFDQAANEGVGAWSHYDRSTFYISDFPTGQNIVKVRYWFNNDEPTLLDVDIMLPSIIQPYTIAASGLDEGFHSFYIQTQAEDDTWSLYDRQIIYVKDYNNLPLDVVSAEYFIDNDPGLGLGTTFGITSSPQVVTFDTGGLSEGDHLFCIRVQNVNGSWSLYDCEVFTIDSSLGLDESLFKSVNINPNPFTNEIDINSDRVIDIKMISVYDITGREVYKTKRDVRKIDLNHLENGTYILSLQTENEKATFKIIKQ